MFRKKNHSGGFVFAEFAIALPLLILLGWGLATVGLKIFYLGKIQLADYVLEEEVHDVLSRIIYDARAAKNVKAVNGAPTLTFTYRTINEIKASDGALEVGDVIADKEEHRVYILVGGLKKKGSKINYKRVEEVLANPITGDNYFGETRVTQFEFEKIGEKVLHITLEMQSEVSSHKIKISTAVYMPGCESF
ncbi:MAG: hypothetical protein IJQ85_01355 [Selenomonadaceae bacterium]|nr:hypothetical protein [Selenomonadaceae bacterium]